MPRRRLTYDEALLRGSAHHNRKRYESRGSAPGVDGPPISTHPPEHWHFDQLEREAWAELLASAPGPLLRADTICVGVAARLWAQWRRQEGNISASEWSRLASWLRKLQIRL